MQLVLAKPLCVYHDSQYLYVFQLELYTSHSRKTAEKDLRCRRIELVESASRFTKHHAFNELARNICMDQMDSSSIVHRLAGYMGHGNRTHSQSRTPRTGTRTEQRKSLKHVSDAAITS